MEIMKKKFPFKRLNGGTLKEVERLREENKNLRNENTHLKDVVETFKVSIEIIKKRELDTVEAIERAHYGKNMKDSVN